MGKKGLNGVLVRMRKLAAVQTCRTLSDRVLLERFVTGSDESAFTVLVERHGPMVHGVCRRLLRHAHDADDACQATFLVLARRAATIRKRTSLASWLHGVACRAAQDLRRAQARRQRRERNAARNAVASATVDITWNDVQTALDEELLRLPERYRSPIILCYLDGKTRDEAAAALGLTTGSLHGRLERGRELLRQGLTRRGVLLSAALLATGLSTGAAHAALPPALVVGTTQAAALIASGERLTAGAISTNVLSLTQGVLKAMFLTKVKINATIAVCLGLAMLFSAGLLAPAVIAQEKYEVTTVTEKLVGAKKGESDEEFIRRISQDLRGKEPTPAEVHFFLASKEANKRQKLIDLFIQERQAKKEFMARVELDTQAYEAAVFYLARPPQFSSIQTTFYRDLLVLSKGTKDVAAVAQDYLNSLMEYVKENPKNKDIPEALLHISLVYRAQGKNVEADAWRAKLLKEYPSSAAAKTAQETNLPNQIEIYLKLGESLKKQNEKFEKSK